MKKALPAVILAICLILLTACQSKDTAPAPTENASVEKKKYSATRLDLFDTVISLSGYAASQNEFNEVADTAFSELEKLHRYYDVYNEYEDIVNICTINSHAGGDALETDPCVIDLLNLSHEIAEKTDRRVDVTSGSVLRLWHDARTKSLDHPENARIPDMEMLRDATAHIGFDKLEIDTEKNTVRLKDPDLRLDVGAVAKGYATERVCRMLPEGYLLSSGGNICATGPKPDGSSWTVGIQDPDGDPSQIICKLAIDSGAVVTSGDYQRVYEVDGVRYHHIIDLTTLMPANRWRSVTIICPDSGIADGLSTALFVLPLEEGKKLLKAYGAEALWMDAERTVYCSDGFKDYIVK